MVQATFSLYYPNSMYNHVTDMDPKLVRQYFEKATALVLASAGVECVEKQALHLLAGEAERYARALGAHAAKLAEASRRTECTAADIEAAASCIAWSKSDGERNRISVSAELKKKLRSSVDMSPTVTTPVAADIQLPQLDADHVDFIMANEEGGQSPSKGLTRRIQVYPEWLQREIETKQHSVKDANKPTQHDATGARHATLGKSEPGPLSFISSLVLAEEESREILTKKLRVDHENSPSRKR